MAGARDLVSGEMWKILDEQAKSNTSHTAVEIPTHTHTLCGIGINPTKEQLMRELMTLSLQ